MKKLLLSILAISAFAATITFTDLAPDSNDTPVILQQKMVQALMENTTAVSNTAVATFATSAELSGILSDESGTGPTLFQIGGTATDYTLNGTTTNSAKEEITTTTLTGTSITLSWTSGGDYRHTMTADTTLALANATGTNRTIVLRAYPNGTHSYIWPSGVVALTPTNQPFAAGLTTIYFDRLDGTNYVSVSPDPLAYLTYTNLDNTAYNATTYNGVTNKAVTWDAFRDKVETLGGGSYVYTIPIGTTVSGNVTATTYYLGYQSGLNSVQGRYVTAVPIAGHVIGYTIHFRTSTTTTAPTGNTLDLWLNNAQVPGGQYALTWTASSVIATFKACTSTAVSVNDLLEVQAVFGGSPSAATLLNVQFNVMIQVP